MAEISLENLRHSYMPRQEVESDWALRQVDLTWRDGGAYALLGPSGCGKTTLLNIISGLLSPTEGRILFDGKDVTLATPDQRNIAQVFQFPVVYDTMTVFNNLAFPLKNRGMDDRQIDARVREVAEMLDLGDLLQKRASGLTADGKQKISLGRGLVRSDVNVIMFDEPLTVIDPHLKWQLRSKLKHLHQKFGFTMIYVTHDQTEALTFADQVVVMHEGEVVQLGTPEQLFSRPKHTFVGHFIGSPGMNMLPCKIENGSPVFAGQTIAIDEKLPDGQTGKAAELGVRPEHIHFDSKGLPVKIIRIDDIGRYCIVNLDHGGHGFKMFAPEDVDIPSFEPRVSFDPQNTHVYVDGWLIGETES